MAYSEKQLNEIFEKVCMRVEDGEPVRQILEDDDVFSRTVFYKLLEQKDKSERYTRAREIRADKIFEEILQIADKQNEDVIRTAEGDIINHNVINRNRLQIDARKWVLSKMLPNKYGDKTKIEHESPDGSMAPVIQLNYKGKDINFKE